MKYCKHCGTLSNDKPEICPVCGKKIERLNFGTVFYLWDRLSVADEYKTHALFGKRLAEHLKEYVDFGDKVNEYREEGKELWLDAFTSTIAKDFYCGFMDWDTTFDVLLKEGILDYDGAYNVQTFPRYFRTFTPKERIEIALYYPKIFDFKRKPPEPKNSLRDGLLDATQSCLESGYVNVIRNLFHVFVYIPSRRGIMEEVDL